MCGICGFISHKNVYPYIVDFLRILEYRGYDSCGIGIFDGKKINVVHFVGAPSQVSWPNLYGNVGIGHTRWATHGKINEENSHPQISCNSDIAVVHNGTLYNYEKLRDLLEKKGHKFKSDTDTEVLPHLIEEYYDGNLESSVIKALCDIRGTYAIAVICSQDPNKIVAARNSNPIALGFSPEGIFLSSDIPTLLSFTQNIVPLNENEIAVLRPREYLIYEIKTGKQVERHPQKIYYCVSGMTKTHDSYTESEIFEQPQRLRECYLLNTRTYEVANEINGAERIYLCGAGTSFHAALLFSYLLAHLGIPSEAIVSSEYPFKSVIDQKTLTIFLSQSGSTYDTNNSIRYAKQYGGKTIGIVNVKESDMEKLVDYVLYTYAGPEIGVASTKNFLNQLYLLLKIWLDLIKLKDNNAAGLETEIQQIPDYVQQILSQEYTHNPRFRTLAENIVNHGRCIIVGAGLSYPIALEWALKIKELSYIDIAAYPSGEIKHGPMATIYNGIPVIAINPQSEQRVFETTQNNINEMKARGANVFEVSDSEKADIKIPKVSYFLSPILTTIPGQLLAVTVAKLLGRNIDKPRNLAKSVTVE
ncbi:MAG: glutamine--fructose-6-phosphate transaminase (isomerizing) [Candidatus Aenigmarchaeota archaeon]|nr:glutamine--fructose-6-phosphate transaminase (isomerizing) [Candidatus Aenigmarchaeota archaeon]